MNEHGHLWDGSNFFCVIKRQWSFIFLLTLFSCKTIQNYVNCNLFFFLFLEDTLCDMSVLFLPILFCWSFRENVGLGFWSNEWCVWCTKAFCVVPPIFTWDFMKIEMLRHRPHRSNVHSKSKVNATYPQVFLAHNKIKGQLIKHKSKPKL